MASIPTTRLMTVDELMAQGSDARVEVVEGEVIPLAAAGVLHHIVEMNVLRVVDDYASKLKSGLVFTDGLLFVLSAEGEGVREARVPDVAFVRKEAIPAEWDIEKPFPGPPTLAVEVISPGDSMEDVLEKVEDYLEAGSEQVWLLFPRRKEMHQYRQDAPGTVRVYGGDDVIDVESLFPGLAIRVSAFFEMPELSGS